MFHESVNYTIHSIHKRDDARAILINATVDNCDITLCNIYTPNKINKRKEFYKTIKYWIIRNADHLDSLILGGDMNCALNNNDRSTGKNEDSSRDVLKNKLHTLNLIDTWYVKNSSPQYTFTDPYTGSKSRIDYIFITKNLEFRVKNITLKQAPKKDSHKCVCLKINLNNNKKGPGYWKLNAKLLEEATFQHLIREVIKECLLENIPDKRLKWELIKIRLKAASIKYGVERASKRKSIIKLIQKELDEINKLEDEGNIIDINRKEELKNKMENYYNEKMDGYLIRSKINWVKEGEKCTSYFFNLEKQRQKANVIHRLKNKEGDIKTKDSEILGIASNFYTELLISRNISQDTIDRYLNETNISNVLSEDQKIKCDAEITEVEVKYTIDALKSGKSPGSDGLIPEFYKCFWNDIKKPFMDMIQETYEKGELPYTMRLTILALLYKKNDAMLLKNYRPISLTNYDYKILAFVLANRVQNIAKYLINPDQSAYIKGRFIGDNARLIEDYFEYCEGLKVPGILLFLDYEKAFDSLEWNFMFSVLEKFNFGQNFIKWVKILYTNTLASIKNNGWLSKTISLGRGVRQGCPLSCLLFVLSVEVLATKLRSNGEIKGFKTPSREIKTSLYADYNTLLLDGLDSL